MDILVDLEVANQFLSWNEKCLEHMSLSIFLFDSL
jgi:hypothetical protein